ncbi:hypothetical protein PsorP6_008846 [Peronosclerospora sorghi]|uniref:Uncharacterized protein n=1 Tax=Peronosclerospora sorghi TaxID=230839 RepID=A0ACC0W1Q2_9STRA|nr:hypothetical protein PsorP6_008846 [Peronosclerospora sorghi]
MFGVVVARGALRSSKSRTLFSSVRGISKIFLSSNASNRTVSARFASTESTPSRFLSLVDDEKGELDEEGQGGHEENEDEDEDEEEEEDSEGKDGDIEVDALPEINQDGVPENDELDELVMELYMENPLRWTPTVLARKFQLSKDRVEAIIWLKRMEAELTPDEFRAKVQEAKERAREEMNAQARKLEEAEASGNIKEVARLKKKMRQEEEATQPDELMEADANAMLMGAEDEVYRNPDFFFLSDEFEGYPPLVRRLGRHGHTDQLYPEEAVELQRLASNNKIELKKSFANPNNSQTKAKFRLAVKDISIKKKHLLIRDENHTLRLATKEEVLPRTWVRREAHFRGLDKELA